MSSKFPFSRLYDEKGNFIAVQISAAVWHDLEPLIAKISMSHPPQVKENTKEFSTFLQSWDYRYPYDPSVSCPHCHSHAKDWREDTPRLFYLHSASLGGMLVFHCVNCSATIRHKYFKNHFEVEFTPPPVP